MKSNRHQKRFEKLDNEDLVLKILLDKMKKNNTVAAANEVARRISKGDNPFHCFSTQELFNCIKIREAFYV